MNDDLAMWLTTFDHDAPAIIGIRYRPEENAMPRLTRGRPPTNAELEDLAQDKADDLDRDDEAGDRYTDEIYRND